MIRELSLFGSILTPEFGPSSDIDFLADFADEANWSLLGLACAELELGEIVGRRVDLVERKSVECSRNIIRRESILKSAKVIYAA
jgi:hypothetical protein